MNRTIRAFRLVCGIIKRLARRFMKRVHPINYRNVNKDSNARNRYAFVNTFITRRTRALCKRGGSTHLPSLVMRQYLITINVLRFPIARTLGRGVINFLRDVRLLQYCVPRSTSDRSQAKREVANGRVFKRSRFTSRTTCFILRRPLRQFTRARIRLLKRATRIIVTLSNLTHGI